MRKLSYACHQDLPSMQRLSWAGMDACSYILLDNLDETTIGK